jgi:hypothetical protein
VWDFVRFGSFSDIGATFPIRPGGTTGSLSREDFAFNANQNLWFQTSTLIGADKDFA